MPDHMIDEYEEIEFPGYADVPGNPEPLAKALLPVDDGSYELNFGDPRSHPVLSTARGDALRLWIKIDQTSGIDGRIVGRITRTHSFTSMADFQPIRTDAWPVKSNLEDAILATSDAIHSSSYADCVLFPAPSIFSSETIPRSLTEFHFSTRRRQRANRHEIPWFCYYSDDKVPMNPSVEALEKIQNVPMEIVEEIRHIFAQRPVISRLAVYCLASDKLKRHLKTILPAFAYYFVNGPWRHTWISYGIDPRKSDEYRVFQVLECRNIFVPSRSASSVYPTKFKGKRGGVQQSRKEAAVHVPANGYIFDGVSLNGNFFIYQLCDMIFPDTAGIVNDIQNIAPEVSERNGWYKDSVLPELRQIVKERWLALKGQHPDATNIDMGNFEDLLSQSTAAASYKDPFSHLDSSLFEGILGEDAMPYIVSSDEEDFFVI